MPTLDIFNDDAFSLASLTAAINETPHVPGRIGALGLFSEQGVTTTTVMVEHQSGLLRLVQSQPRGASGQVVGAEKRKMRSFIVPHLPQRDSIRADEIQNVRAFGSENEVQAVQTVVNNRLASARRNLDATIEYHRLGAIKGLILDADGEPIYDLFDEFGIDQQTHAMALATAGTDVLGKVVAAKRLAEDELGGAMVTGYRAFCGAGFFDAFVGHAKVKEAYQRWQDGELLRSDNRGGFMFGGVMWEEYRGKVGNTDFIGADEAYLVPEGVPDLFITRFAPADYMETVNTNGLPYYAKTEPQPFNKGVDLEAQSNPLNLCSRPRAVIKLTK